MSIPIVQARRAHPALGCRPAREMSRRGIAIVIGIYVVLFGAAALHLWLTR